MHKWPGDIIVGTFQCDWCWFDNLDINGIDLESYSDSQTLGCICREIWTFFGEGIRERFIMFL